MTTFIFAGGGSGGHIHPALAIHEEVARADPESRSVFVCSDRPLDAQILNREGVEYCIVPAKPLSMRIRGIYRFLRGWGPSVRSGRSLIREARARGQVQVVAMGGFVAAPIAQAARAERAPLMLVNLDAIPGKANRLIAKRCPHIVTTVPVVGPSASLPWTIVPPIVRRSSQVPGTAAECRKSLGLDPDRRTLLITGGSQGAVTINRLVLATLRESPEAFRGWQVIHQTGRGEEESATSDYAAAGVPAVVQAFFEKMGLLWCASDLAVSRAGAGGVAEAWAYQVPTLFLPNPYHKDQHQKHNAHRLVEAGGASVVSDSIEEPSKEAKQRLKDLMADAAILWEMKSKMALLGPADGAAQISRMLTGPKNAPIRPRSGLFGR